MFEKQYIVVNRSEKSYIAGQNRQARFASFALVGSFNLFWAIFLTFKLNILSVEHIFEYDLLSSIPIIIFFSLICVGEYVGYRYIKKQLEKLRAKWDYAKRTGFRKSYSKRKDKKENYAHRNETRTDYGKR